MDKLAEKMAEWFGSAPFILFHIIWFTAWITLHFTTGFDADWQVLTVVVSLEAIFLSLFILRAENVQSSRTEEQIRQDLRESKKELKLLKRMNHRIPSHKKTTSR